MNNNEDIKSFRINKGITEEEEELEVI